MNFLVMISVFVAVYLARVYKDIMNKPKYIIDWDNSKLPHDGSRILATNGLIHSQMEEVLTQEKYKIYI